MSSKFKTYLAFVVLACVIAASCASAEPEEISTASSVVDTCEPEQLGAVVEKARGTFGDNVAATDAVGKIALAVDCGELMGAICTIEHSDDGLAIVREVGGDATVVNLTAEQGTPAAAGICLHPDRDKQPDDAGFDAEDQFCSARAGILVVNRSGLPSNQEFKIPMSDGSELLVSFDVLFDDDQIGTEYAVVRYEPGLLSPYWLAEVLRDEYPGLNPRPASMVGSSQGWAYSPELPPESKTTASQFESWNGTQLPETDGSDWLVVVIDSGFARPGALQPGDEPPYTPSNVPSYTDQTYYDYSLNVLAESDADPIVDVDHDGFQDWVYGHGTFVAGIIDQRLKNANYYFVRPSIESFVDGRFFSYLAYFDENLELRFDELEDFDTPGSPDSRTELGELHIQPLESPLPRQVMVYDELQLTAAIIELQQDLQPLYVSPVVQADPVTPGAVSTPSDEGTPGATGTPGSGDEPAAVGPPPEPTPAAGAEVGSESASGGVSVELAPDLDALARKNPRLLVNISMGYYSCDSAKTRAVESALESAIADLMVIVDEANGYLVAAAGNEESADVRFYPAAWAPSYDRAVSVGSVNRHGAHSSFTNSGEWVEAYAQGEEVVSLFPWVRRHAGEKQDGDSIDFGELRGDRPPLALWSGTSFATPCAAVWLMTKDPAPGSTANVGAAVNAMLTAPAGATETEIETDTENEVGAEHATSEADSPPSPLRCWTHLPTG